MQEITPANVTDIQFFCCLSCGCEYTLKTGGELHDRWLMPLTIVLYNVIYAQDPLAKIDVTMDQLQTKKPEFINALAKHIEDELDAPKQKLCDIHDFVYPNEQKLRDFLREVLHRLAQLKHAQSGAETVSSSLSNTDTRLLKNTKSRLSKLFNYFVIMIAVTILITYFY
ncbi:hypothetical protein NBRC116595_02870 [Aliiglaciecola sp. NS0011-25]